MTRLTAVQVSHHELRHLYGDAIALVALGTEKQYEKAEVYYDVKDGEGETAVHFHPIEEAQKVASLSALAPVAKAGETVIDLIRKKEWSTLQRIGDLSQRDIDLASRWDGAPTMFIRVALGVVNLEKRIGVARFQKQAKIMRDAISAGVTEPFLLSDFVPYSVAKKAHNEAKAFIETKMMENVQFGGFQERF